ncbi:zinc metalloprotease [Steroidobacter agaridevorans]|uniref:Zinc metalloprotease n=1 Tax=Steroidobacter agaridevorans TaxID=2695856 RepID=A0A829YL64_9GAMM|nr:M13-type metalloendopeptidase [Steroidobacter agaridevorans]GFE84045.1 zinc metalloprotease [Steroidobacter agaridevorans]
MKKSLLLIVALALSSGCAKQEPKPVADANADAPAAPKVELGEFGLDLTAGNPQIKPGDDFFAFASGKWYDTFEIPPDRSSYGPFHKLNDLAEERVKKLIEQAAQANPAAGTPEQKVGDYFASYMDEAGIEARGLQPIEADLARIQAAKTKKDIATLFGLPGFMSAFGVGISPDSKNPSRYSIDIGQSGLGLPDRDYYLKDDAKLKEHRAKYLAFIEQMLTLGGVQDAAKKARGIMEFETALAKVQWPLEKRRDAEATYNPRTKAQLLAYAPGFEWQAFFDASDVGARENFVLGPLTAIRDSAKVVDKTSVDTLKDYLTFHMLRTNSPFLPKRFDQANFAFYGQQLRGQPQQRERWKRGVAITSDALGELVGQVYVKEYFPPDSKAKMEVLVANLRAALKERLATLSWMSPETRQRAEEKLDTFVAKIGYPDKWKDYSALEVKRDDVIGNVRRASIWDWHRQVARLDRPVDRDEWFMNVTDINAYYNPLNNEIVFPAAILQPPFFDPAADDAVNYGGIGAVIGHEIGHGFDDQGRKYAPDGSLTDWWTKADAEAFGAKTKVLVEQYSGFDALPGLKVNGATSLGENIGDLGGLNMAYEAYHNSLQGKQAPVLGGLTGDQRFFLSWAQVWRTKIRDEALRAQVLSDPHAPPYFRVNGAVRNMDEWYAAFDVKPGEKLFLAPEQRVKIW